MRALILIEILVLSKTRSQSVPNVCFCVTSGFCNNNPGTGQDGSNQIDIRIQANGNSAAQTGTPLAVTFPVSSGINYVVNNNQNCQQGLQSCCPSVGYQCGMRYPPIQGSRQPQPGSGQSQYGSHPWIAVIITNSEFFVGTGALIDHQHVLTVAHKVANYTNNIQSLVVLLGEWDAGSNSEPLSSQRFGVSRIFTHPQANYQNLRNDIAIVRLSTFTALGVVPTIAPACLPNTTIPMNIRCWVAGWGVSTFGNGDFSTIQKEVDVPLIDSNLCQNYLRATRLGSNFILDATSFLCAGGEQGKDSCTGDGGAPLVCQIVNQFYVIGLVAWGIGCGGVNVPGVYVNVGSYVSWIQQTTRQN